MASRSDPDSAREGGALDDPLDQHLRALWAPAPAPSAELRARLLAEVAQEHRTGPYNRPARARRWARGLLAAAAAAALVVFGLRVSAERTRGRAAEAQAAAQARDGQAELSLEDEQFALATGPDDDADEVDDAPSLVELAAEE